MKRQNTAIMPLRNGYKLGLVRKVDMDYKKQLQVALNVYWRAVNDEELDTLEQQYYYDKYQKALATYQELLAWEAFDYER